MTLNIYILDTFILAGVPRKLLCKSIRPRFPQVNPILLLHPEWVTDHGKAISVVRISFYILYKYMILLEIKGKIWKMDTCPEIKIALRVETKTTENFRKLTYFQLSSLEGKENAFYCTIQKNGSASLYFE